MNIFTHSYAHFHTLKYSYFLFLNSCLKYFQVLDLVELEMRDIITDFGYDGSTVPVIKGSALKALNDDMSNIGRIIN